MFGRRLLSLALHTSRHYYFTVVQQNIFLVFLSVKFFRRCYGCLLYSFKYPRAENKCSCLLKVLLAYRSVIKNLNAVFYFMGHVRTHANICVHINSPLTVGDYPTETKNPVTITPKSVNIKWMLVNHIITYKRLVGRYHKQLVRTANPRNYIIVCYRAGPQKVTGSWEQKVWQTYCMTLKEHQRQDKLCWTQCSMIFFRITLLFHTTQNIPSPC